jgi:omega-6 fatty acid desaturase (delta-12 desaturase)
MPVIDMNMITSQDGVTSIKQNEVVIPDLTIKDLLSAIP